MTTGLLFAFTLLLGHAHHHDGTKLGDFHPMFLHFPFVLFITAFVLDCLFLIKTLKKRDFADWFVVIAALFAIPTVITGLYAMDLGHADGPYILLHRNWAIATLIYSIVHATFRVYVRQKKRFFRAYVFVFLSLINVGLIAITSEYGGIITRGKGLFIPSQTNA
jgi:uncharacterized membrane protein